MSVAPIVVGTDGSEYATRAVDRAAEIAVALGAPLHVAMCFESIISPAMAIAGAGIGPLPADDYADERAREVVDRAASALARKGVTAKTHICQGEPSDALITLATGLGAQMIVVGNRGMSGARRVLGSVPNRVSHHADCAVLIVPTAQPH
jgi:nucleotide-binding universal stress UspA family protein